MRRVAIHEAVLSAACAVALCACSVDDDPGADEVGAAGNGNASDGANGTTAFSGPVFPGAGASRAGDSIAAGVDTACGPTGGSAVSNAVPAQDARASILCFYGGDKEEPAASIEWIVETASDSELVHIRLTLDPTFVDNSYGESQIGWGGDEAAPEDGRKKKKGGHTFKDLVGSDHAEMLLTDASGNVVLHFKLDYISEDPTSPSGYATLGVMGGDGKMIEGDASQIVEVATSLDRNLNACGLSQYTESSPASDAAFTTSIEAPDWDYRVVYDVWVRRSAFGSAGFGQALIENVHASPSKASDNTIEVTPGDCPPDWERYCRDPNGCKTEECGGLDNPCSETDPPPPDEEPCMGLDDECGTGGEPPPPPNDDDCKDLPDGCPRPD